MMTPERLEEIKKAWCQPEDPDKEKHFVHCTDAWFVDSPTYDEKVIRELVAEVERLTEIIESV